VNPGEKLMSLEQALAEIPLQESYAGFAVERDGGAVRISLFADNGAQYALQIPANSPKLGKFKLPSGRHAKGYWRTSIDGAMRKLFLCENEKCPGFSLWTEFRLPKNRVEKLEVLALPNGMLEVRDGNWRTRYSVFENTVAAAFEGRDLVEYREAAQKFVEANLLPR
jgi:hypothetical protein